MRITQLNKQYELICNEYVAKFCKKQEMDFNGWIANKVGEVAECNDFYFNLSDIILDLKSKSPKGEIINWYYQNLETKQSINYYSYTKGLRVAHLNKKKKK